MPGLEVAPCALAGSIDHDDLLSDKPKAPPGYKVLGRLGQGTFGEVRLPCGTRKSGVPWFAPVQHGEHNLIAATQRCST